MTRPTIEHDDDQGVTIIDGTRYANGLLSGFGQTKEAGAFPIGTFMRIVERRDGTITVRRFSPELEAQFCALAGLPKP